MYFVKWKLQKIQNIIAFYFSLSFARCQIINLGRHFACLIQIKEQSDLEIKVFVQSVTESRSRNLNATDKL